MRIKNIKINIKKSQIRNIKRWSLTAFAISLLLTSLFVLNAFAKTETQSSIILKMTNKERASRSLEPLSENRILERAAYAKARDMFDNQYFDHISPQGRTPWYFINEAGYDYAYAGENLAIDFDDITSIQTAWMNSPSHRENILNSSFKDLGVVSVTDLYKGKTTTITVEMFGRTMFDTVIDKFLLSFSKT
ncbi:MAG: CAP domain-containing protein [bacterium]|nr:CAP domain-containing protein [bacterium]